MSRKYPFHHTINPNAITSSFAAHKNRKPPSTFPGTDYGVPCGLPIYAPDDGQLGDYVDGNGTIYAVWISKDGKERWDFLHVEKAHVARKAWKNVSKGQEIAISGSTGKSTGCHCHLSIRINGKFVDPEPIVRAIWQAEVSQPTTPTDKIKKTYTVTSVDWRGLESIAEKLYGDINRRYDLVNWNKGKYPSLVSNPGHIEAGWVLTYYVDEPTKQEIPKEDPKPVPQKPYKVVVVNANYDVIESQEHSKKLEVLSADMKNSVKYPNRIRLLDPEGKLIDEYVPDKPTPKYRVEIEDGAGNINSSTEFDHFDDAKSAYEEYKDKIAAHNTIRMLDTISNETITYYRQEMTGENPQEAVSQNNVRYETVASRIQDSISYSVPVQAIASSLGVIIAFNNPTMPVEVVLAYTGLIGVAVNTAYALVRLVGKKYGVELTS